MALTTIFKVRVKWLIHQEFSPHYICLYMHFVRNLLFFFTNFYAKFWCSFIFFLNPGGSVGDLRLLAGSTRSIPSFGNSNRMTKRLNQAAAAVELELYSMVGRLQIEIKGLFFLIFIVRMHIISGHNMRRILHQNRR